MIYRKFGSLSEKVSAIGFGTWAIGGEANWSGHQLGWGPSSEKESIKAIHRAVELGINFFDTAGLYGLGKSELILGRALKKKEAIICTKAGNRLQKSGITKDFSKSFIRKSLQESLRRLGRDYVDVLLLHSPPDNFDWEQYDRSYLDELKRSGIIRCYGVSCRSVDGIKGVLKYQFGDVLEVIYNIFDRRAEKMLPKVEESGIAFIGRVPLGSGFLTGKRIQSPPKFLPTDHRADLSKEETAWRFQNARKVEFLNDLPGGMVCAALRFCLSQSAISTTIPGMRSVKQVEENASAADYPPLDAHILAKIKKVIPSVYSGWITKN